MRICQNKMLKKDYIFFLKTSSMNGSWILNNFWENNGSMKTKQNSEQDRFFDHGIFCFLLFYCHQ